MAKRTVVIGIGGPVGSGKTLLVERLTRRMSDLNLAVITNDIYTKEDALFLAKNSNLGEDRIIGVETGGCPHTAIREDASMNFEAIETLQERFNHDLDVIFLESGGDNLAATFSPDLVDFTIYIIDVAQGEKIPRKAGQGMIKSDLFLINKTDLAPYVGANLDRMREDTLHFRQEDSFVFTNLNNAENVKEVENWVRKHFLLEGL
ncbi:urease accessory protein UreG [Streptococcus infantarius]|uniref:Urease accessory protein UreG n=2 Tax=Streptococcus infantarius TaxID=102684 RepID=A0A380KNB2_9STRE|nr:urease accessory protein UreG [Streptococcus infantarius]MCO4476845.1 Urease accessory protein UreG [Streptococcus infantarius subsp. infantarius]MCO4486429.1 Urease accessory protein UreG [Streptococcus infantarius subsp. infantarius]MCO4495570.1 Urease accessory protein UreG [Streptococcus infantarius subsp. infantarius]MCO4499920.1 Urease accessory protein UreG [Streptococcus infantarius subsp. infantarius]MCO4503678.1 Urease accessory protein UreG [Streptococcus infantarius subsp. infan